MGVERAGTSQVPPAPGFPDQARAPPPVWCLWIPAGGTLTLQVRKEDLALLPPRQTQACSGVGSQWGRCSQVRPSLWPWPGPGPWPCPRFPRERCPGERAWRELSRSTHDYRLPLCPCWAHPEEVSKAWGWQGGAGGNSRGIGSPRCQGNRCWRRSLHGVRSRLWAGGTFR